MPKTKIVRPCKSKKGNACNLSCRKYKRKGRILCRKGKATKQAMRVKIGAKAWRAHKKQLKGEPPKFAYQKFMIPYMRGTKS